MTIHTDKLVPVPPSTGTTPTPDETPFEYLLRTRHSCRAFLGHSLERDVLERILQAASRSASWCNAQPWRALVVSGDVLDALARHLAAASSAGEPKCPDLAPPLDYTEERRERRRESGFALYGALGISRSDLDARQEQHLRNYQFFGAPHVVVVTTASELQEYGAVDAGAFLHNILLAAAALGVASCPQAAPALYAGKLHEFLDIPVDQRVVATVALGYEDVDHAVNSFRTTRAPLQEIVRFCE